MKYDDMVKTVSAKLDEEIKDCNAYLTLASDAIHSEVDDAHYEERANMITSLCEIAKDEFTHAHYIYALCKQSAVEISAETLNAYHALETRIHEFPRT